MSTDTVKQSEIRFTRRQDLKSKYGEIATCFCAYVYIYNIRYERISTSLVVLTNVNG